MHTVCCYGDDGLSEASETPSETAETRSEVHTQRNFLATLQALRFLAAFMVVVYHARFALPNEVAASMRPITLRVLDLGASGVHIFFVISGFVMVLNGLHPSRPMRPGEFLSRRFIRIYPIYLLIGGLYLAAHALWGTPYALSVADVALAAALIPPYSALVIGPGWTLSFELYFYFCFAVCLFLPRRMTLPVLTAFFLGSITMGRLYGFTDTIYVPTNSLLIEFLAGAWLASWYLGGGRIKPRVGTVLIAVGIGLFVAGAMMPEHRYPSAMKWGGPALILVAGFLAIEPFWQGRLSRIATTLGDSSYFLYLSHILLLDLLSFFVGGQVGLGNMAGVGASIALALPIVVVAHAGYLWIEKPLLGLMKRALVRGW